MFKNAKSCNIEDQHFWLLPEKVIYWQERNVLLVADLHIGKSGHFRKHGIAVPRQVNKSTLENLSQLIDDTSSDHLIILGDLFHSDINKEWRQFMEWRQNYRNLEISLVIGNHDILKKEKYHAGIINIFNKMKVGPFLLVHDLNEFENTDDVNHYILSGHIHPAVQLKGRGRQTIKLPCFYFGKNFGILPAFGQFTGTHVIEPKSEDSVYLIAESKIISGEKTR